MSAASIIFKAAEFFTRYPLGMARSGYVALPGIIFTAGIFIFKNNCKRGTRGIAIKPARLKDGNIIFLSGGGTFLDTPFSAFDICYKIFSS